MTRLWFYLLASALLSIVGIQLLVAWIVMRVLEQLAQREAAARRDLDEEGNADRAIENAAIKVQSQPASARGD